MPRHLFAPTVGPGAQRSPKGGAPSIVLVGHGSRDPRSAAALTRLTDRVRASRPELDVRLCFLELSVPSLEQTLRGLHGDVVVVPLLLSSAYHATVDIPQRVFAATQLAPQLDVTITPPLGADPRLVDALVARVCRAPRVDGWVLAATGSSHAAANDELRALAGRMSGRLRAPVRPGFVTVAAPDLTASVASLRDAGCSTVGLLPWFLAPGRLLDRGIRAAGVEVVADPLADHDLTAQVVLARYDSARPAALLADRRRMRGAGPVA